MKMRGGERRKAGGLKGFKISGLLFLGISFFVPVCLADGLRDVRGPAGLQPDWGWRLGLLALAGFAGIVWGIRSFLRPRKEIASAPPPRPSWEIAWEALDHLEKNGLVAQGRVQEYYVQLSHIVRHYIEGRFLIQAPEMTTQEFMEKAQHSENLSDAQRVFLRDFLDASDMVKFARFVPSPEEIRGAMSLARRFIEETRPEERSEHGI